MAKYLVLVRRSGIPSTLSPQEMQKVVQKYMNWSEDLRKAGRVVHAEKLRAGEGRVVRGNGGKMAVTDGPYAESKEIIGGFWLIEAGGYDEMLELLASHPHLDGPGTLEVREVEDTSRRG
jgi:hypothetical protein